MIGMAGDVPTDPPMASWLRGEGQLRALSLYGCRTRGGGNAAPTFGEGGRPSFWPDSTSQSPDLDDSRLNLRLSVWRSRMPQSRADPVPLAGPDALGTSMSGFATSNSASSTDSCLNPGFARGRVRPDFPASPSAVFPTPSPRLPRGLVELRPQPTPNAPRDLVDA